jgi:hypothetical protein
MNVNANIDEWQRKLTKPYFSGKEDSQEEE